MSNAVRLKRQACNAKPECEMTNWIKCKYESECCRSYRAVLYWRCIVLFCGSVRRCCAGAVGEVKRLLRSAFTSHCVTTAGAGGVPWEPPKARDSQRYAQLPPPAPAPAPAPADRAPRAYCQRCTLIAKLIRSRLTGSYYDSEETSTPVF